MKPLVTVQTGDCVEQLAGWDNDTFDAVVTDPPYGLGFMGKEWDHGVPAVQVWREILRVAKPGVHLIAFGGTRTWHRLACAIEDAGWEIRDTLAWMYGQGFPKSLNLDGAWAGWGTALKPAFEPIILARKPLVGTVAANVLAHGTGGINIDGCRIGFASDADRERSKPQGKATSRKAAGDGGLGAGYRETERGEFVFTQSAKGRWPANVVLDEEAAAMLDEQTGTLTSGAGSIMRESAATKRGNTSAAYGKESRGEGCVMVSYADSGGASRFFYVAKASRSERTHGGKVENKHPTVKPLALMEWLIKLVTPPGGTVLDPFAGSGTTPVAAVAEGFDCVAIEKDPAHVEIVLARLRATGVNPRML